MERDDKYTEDVFCLHYHTEELHRVDAKTFIAGIHVTEEIINALAYEYRKKPNINIKILAPKEGGLNEFIQFAVQNPEQLKQFVDLLITSEIVDGITVSGILGYLHTKYGSTFLKKLTGHTTEEYHGYLGDIIRVILLLPIDAIKKLPIPKKLKYLIIKVKSKYFNKLDEDREVKALGINDGYEPNIPRKEFPNHIARDFAYENMEIRRLKVIDSVKTVEKRQWIFEDCETGEPIKAYMAPNKFREGFLAGKYKMKSNSGVDEMLVLIHHRLKLKLGDETNNSKVLIVFEFNGEVVEELTNNY